MTDRRNGDWGSGPDTGPNPASNVRLVFALVIAAVFLDVIDFSIVQVALPSIRTEFRVPLAESQWIVGVYGITMAGFLLLSGRAGDIYGQKKLFVFGVILFTLASLTGGVSPSLLALVISRAVQGIGAAISSVTALSIFVALFPEGKERNRALGIFVAVISAGFAAGSIAGGVLTMGLGWRSVLFVNVPIGAATALLSWRFLPESTRAGTRHLDLAGALTVTSGLMLLVYALTNAANDGLSAISAIVPLAVALVVLVAFLVIESRSSAPLMPLAFLRRGSVLNANVLALLLTTSMVGPGFILTIYMQQILGYSPLSAGLAFLPPAMIFFLVGGWGSSRFVNRFGVRRVLLVSTALVAVGLALLTQIAVGGSYFGILPGMVVWAFGASIGLPALSIAALAGTQPGEEGLASGLISTSQRVGFPLGLAALLTVVAATDPAPVGTDLSASAAGVVTGFQFAFVAAALFAVAGLALAFRLEDGKGPSARAETGEIAPD
jgi:EmrB/QacA subfamily drug resistance transporter